MLKAFEVEAEAAMGLLILLDEPHNRVLPVPWHCRAVSAGGYDIDCEICHLLLGLEEVI